MLERVNKHFLKVNFKKLFLFYLVVIICCNVAVSEVISKPSGVSLWGQRENCDYISENEVIHQKFFVVAWYKMLVLVKCLDKK